MPLTLDESRIINAAKRLAIDSGVPEDLFDGVDWDAAEEYASLDQPERYEAKHAPTGGVTVQGTFYPGGQWIPSDVMDRATPQEKAAVEGKAPAATSQQPQENQQPAQPPTQQQPPAKAKAEAPAEGRSAGGGPQGPSGAAEG